MAELDHEEREILKAFEAGQLNRAVDADELLKRHREYAAAMLRTDARINVRLTTRDLRRL
jgi:predicted DNA binding CopG/RHH family protein